MIENGQGNILEAPVDALVNTVNCVGVMGKGIALQFKRAFPENYFAYRTACRHGEVAPGKLLFFAIDGLGSPRWIINFPTKRHWRDPSHLEDIEAGLRALRAGLLARGIHSVAIPPVGCGLGGLDWERVQNLIVRFLGDLQGVRVVVFPPSVATRLAMLPKTASRPALTLSRALYLVLMERYGALRYERTLLEVQKLAYFLQAAGQPLRLRFEAAPFGPYADNLNKVLETLEGAYITGYTGNRGPDIEIQLMPNAAADAAAFLNEHGDPDSMARLDRVTRLIDGFEEPHGLELLATVHWVATRETPAADDATSAAAHIARWSSRKQRLLMPHHVATAWQRLVDEGWIPPATGSTGPS